MCPGGGLQDVPRVYDLWVEWGKPRGKGRCNEQNDHNEKACHGRFIVLKALKPHILFLTDLPTD
jgi:hypothetical protein